MTPYNYAENSPIANIDLWGLQAWDMISRDPNYNGYTDKTKEERIKELRNKSNILLLPYLFLESRANNKAKAFLELGSSVVGPIVNRASIIANEGVHEGGAYYTENEIEWAKNTYTFNEDWDIVIKGQTSDIDNLDPHSSAEIGKETMKNVVEVIATIMPIGGSTIANKIINTSAKELIKNSAKEGIDALPPNNEKQKGKNMRK